MVKKKTLPFLPRFCISCKTFLNFATLSQLPGTQMTSIFAGQPPKTRPKFQSKQGENIKGFQAYPTYISRHIYTKIPPSWKMVLVFHCFLRVRDFLTSMFTQHPASQIRSAQLPRSMEWCPGRRHDPTFERWSGGVWRVCPNKIRCEGFNDVFGVGLTILQCEGFNDVSGLGRLSIIAWLAHWSGKLGWFQGFF